MKRIVKTSCARANHARFKEGLQLLQEDAQTRTPPPKIELPRSADLFYLVPAVVSCCRVGLVDGIPKELDEFLKLLEGLGTCILRGNPWVEPPAAVVVKGVPAIRSYFVDLYRGKRVMSRNLKVVLVGREGTGKTRCSQSCPFWCIPSLYVIWCSGVVVPSGHVSHAFFSHAWKCTDATMCVNCCVDK